MSYFNSKKADMHEKRRERESLREKISAFESSRQALDKALTANKKAFDLMREKSIAAVPRGKKREEIIETVLRSIEKARLKKTDEIIHAVK